ncbi:ribonuclease H-like domain-containing protein [Tanacetum coccineum]
MKLSGIENYRVWTAAMKLAINTRNKTGFIDGTCVKSAYANNNAVEVWADLKETYDKLDGSIISNLLQKIHGFKQGELTVSEYYHKLNSLWREFDIMTKLPKKVRHTIDRCFGLIGYPPGYNKNPGLKKNGSKTFNANSTSTSNEKERGDGAVSIKQRRRDLSSDGDKKLMTTSGRNRLKSDLEDSIS